MSSQEKKKLAGEALSSTIKTELIQEGENAPFVIRLTNEYTSSVHLDGTVVSFLSCFPLNGNPWFIKGLKGSLESKTQKQDDQYKIEITLRTKALIAPRQCVEFAFSVKGNVQKNDFRELRADLIEDPQALLSFWIKMPSLVDVPATEAAPVAILYPNGPVKEVQVPVGGRLQIEHLFKGHYIIVPLKFTYQDKILEPISIRIDLFLDSANDGTEVELTYREKYSVLVDFVIDPIPGVSGEVYTNIYLNNQPYYVQLGITNAINLIADTKYDITSDPIKVNNTEYLLYAEDGNSFTPARDQNNVVHLELKSSSIDITNAVKVKILLEGIPFDAPPLEVSLKELGCNNSYFFTVFPLILTPVGLINKGTFQLDAKDVWFNETLYRLDNSDPVIIDDNSVNNPIVFRFKIVPSMLLTKTQELKSAKNWPSFFTLGGYTNNTAAVQTKYLSSKTGGIYSYSGRNKQGDRGVILNASDFISTTQTLNQAEAIEIAQSHPVMPTMVHYTANLLSGNTVADLTNLNNLKIHFMNLITEVSLAQGFTKCAFLLSPGFLGKIQQLRGSYAPYGELFSPNSIQVTTQLRNAISQLGLTDQPPNFDNNLQGYCQSINWIFHHFGQPDVSFGWIVSPWQTGNIDWLFGSSDQTTVIAGQVNAFLNEVGVYQDIVPDFIVFDAGEHWDDFSTEAIPRGYAWNATAWQRYLRFVGIVSNAQRSPAVLYQVPGAHMPNKSEGPSLVTNDHAGSGASFFMGDPTINFDVANTVVPALLALPLNYPAYNARTVTELLAHDAGYDWSLTKIPLAIRENVFAIYFGSPESTSIVSSIPNTGDSWLANKTGVYYAAPIPLS